jgi:hypothetical protein
VSPEERRTALEEACEELGPGEGRKDNIPRAADAFMAIGCAPRLSEETKAARLRSYRPAGKKVSEAELERYAKAAEELAAAAEGMHQPAILALAEVGGTPWRREGEALRERAVRARVAKVWARTPTAPKPGRPVDGLSRVAAELVIHHFGQITGASAYLPAKANLPGARGGLAQFAVRVWQILDIPGDARNTVNRVLEGEVAEVKRTQSTA